MFRCVSAGPAVSAWIVVGMIVVEAHDLSTSESRVTVADATVRVRLSFDLLAVPGVDANSDMKVSYDELDQSIERVFAVVKRHYQVSSGAPPSRVTLERHDLADDHGVTLELLYVFDEPVRRVAITETFHDLAAPSHQHLVSAAVGGELQRAMLSASYPTATFAAGGMTLGGALAVGAALLVVGGLIGYRVRSAVAARRLSKSG